MKENWIPRAFGIFCLTAVSLASGAEGEKHHTVAEACIHKDGYTINFNNVSIIEYIRFVSKITNTNFVFDDKDLQFNVTIISEDAISPENVMSALLQILRMHGLTLLEQENNLLITASRDISQISTLVSGDGKGQNKCKSPIVTRVFRIKNANLTSVAGIIRPMMSSAALIEISAETRQLIVTDITTNIDKIADLLATLDAPHSAVEIDSYAAKNISPSELVALTQQIITPFLEGQAFTLVPQLDTNTIFIVSSPFLVERALTIMEDLDVPTKDRIASTSAENIFIYRVLHRSVYDIIDALNHVASDLSKMGGASATLIATIRNVKPIEDSNSLLFVGDDATIAKLQALLSGIDNIPLSEEAIGPESFYLYKLKYAQGSFIEQHLKQVGANLKVSSSSNRALLQTIEKVKWIPESNSILITGPLSAVEQVKSMIADWDVEGAPSGLPPSKSSFFIYKPIHRKPEDLETILTNVGVDLKESGLIDSELFDTISSMRYVDATQSLLFTGTPSSLEKLQNLLTTVDVASAIPIQRLGELTFFIYQPQHTTATQLMTSLKNIGDDLEKNGGDPALAKTLETMRFVKDTNSILFTGPEKTLEKVETLIKKFDVGGGPVVPRAPGTYVLYVPQYRTGAELIEMLCDFEQSLKDSGIDNEPLFMAINHVKWIEKTCSLLISGPEEALTQVQDLLARFDTPTKETAIAAVKDTSFLIYKLQYHPGDEIQAAIKQVATDLAKTGSESNEALLQATQSLQWVKMTNSLLSTGAPPVLAKLRDIIQSLDIPLKQVFIEILVIETAVTNTQSFGLQWGGKAQYLNKVGAGSGNFPATNPLPNTPNSGIGNIFQNNLAGINATTTPTGASVPFATGFDLGVIGDIIMHKGRSFLSLGALVNALQTDNDSTILMNPKIIAQDSKTSTIFIGTNQPFVGSLVQVVGSGANSTNTSLEYRDVGFNLTITPVLGQGDIVTLDISNDISEVIQAANVGNTAVSGITTSHTSMTTNVHVPDNHFLVLSGMIQESKARFKSGIPCLGGLPVLGMAFSENDRVYNKANVIFFIRPHIIQSFEEYKLITEDQENLFREKASLPILKEEFDDAVDILKATAE